MYHIYKYIRDPKSPPFPRETSQSTGDKLRLIILDIFHYEGKIICSYWNRIYIFHTNIYTIIYIYVNIYLYTYV